MLVMGSTIYSAKAPLRFTPTPSVRAHRCRRPARQLRQRPHTTWPSPLTTWPGAEARALSPTPHHPPPRHFRAPPRVPLVNMQIGPENPRLQPPDLHIVDADRRFRNVFEP